MTELRIDNSNAPMDDAMEAEVLIGRIIDNEASPADIERFRQLAAMEPLIWRRLANRQQDMILLAEQFDLRMASALETELASTSYGHAGTDGRAVGKVGGGRKLSLLLSFSGWAAVLILAAVWTLTMQIAQSAGQAGTIHSPGIQSYTFSAEDHLKAYLRSDRVIGELDPIMLEVVELPNGRVRINSIRRIEEVEYFDSLDALPLYKVNEIESP